MGDFDAPDFSDDDELADDDAAPATAPAAAAASVPANGGDGGTAPPKQPKAPRVCQRCPRKLKARGKLKTRTGEPILVCRDCLDQVKAGAPIVMPKPRPTGRGGGRGKPPPPVMGDPGDNPDRIATMKAGPPPVDGQRARSLTMVPKKGGRGTEKPPPAAATLERHTGVADAYGDDVDWDDMLGDLSADIAALAPSAFDEAAAGNAFNFVASTTTTTTTVGGGSGGGGGGESTGDCTNCGTVMPPGGLGFCLACGALAPIEDVAAANEAEAAAAAARAELVYEDDDDDDDEELEELDLDALNSLVGEAQDLLADIDS